MDVDIVLENSVIKGYHQFKIKPPMTTPDIHLNIFKEYTNIKDKNACLVWIPELENIPHSQHHIATDATRQLMLTDVAGLPLGHVPRGLGHCFRQALDMNGMITAIPTGNPMPSFSPWPQQHESGGGIVIPCTYKIKVPSNKRRIVKALIQEALNLMPESTIMKLSN